MAPLVSWRRVISVGVGAVVLVASTLTIHAGGQNQSKDRDKDRDDAPRVRLPQLGPAAQVPACYNSVSGEWRVVHPWSSRTSPAAACRPPAPWDSVNVPAGGWGQLTCNAGGAFDCDANESFIEINSIGPQGPPGPTGAAGKDGRVGPQGPAGPSGSVGPAGPVGPPGPVGPKGDVGQQGPIGATGPQGAAGVKGDDGARGVAGDKGETGPRGETGARGDKGEPGDKGGRGDKGDRGDNGAPGAKGDPGDKGDTGAQGPPGPIGPTGLGFTYRGAWDGLTQYRQNDVVTEAGSAFVASNDNVGIDPTLAAQVPGGDWALMAAKGEVGPTGPQGEQGPQGVIGPIGPQGGTGAQGPQGPAGAQGPQGPDGAQGAQGPAGATGATGPTGPSGTTGQGAASVVSTASLVLTNGTLTDVPGLSLAATVTSATSAIVVSSDGGVQVNSLVAGQIVGVDIFLFVDGDALPKQIVQRRIYAVNPTVNPTIAPNIANWSFTVAVSGLAPGVAHNFRVASQLVATNGSAAVVAGSTANGTGVLRGTLTAVVVNK